MTEPETLFREQAIEAQIAALTAERDALAAEHARLRTEMRLLEWSWPRFLLGFALPVIALPVAALVGGAMWFFARSHH